MGLGISRSSGGGGNGRASRPPPLGVVQAPLGVDLNSFDYIHDTDFGMMAIGKGGFGLVSVMRLTDASARPNSATADEDDDNLLFAVKSMSKYKLIQREMVENTLNELEILSGLSRHHNNIVNCHYAFQDAQQLYIVLDLCLGGSVAHALQRAGKFPLSRAKHYVAELIIGIKFLHSERIVHRDIKPDNVLIDARGRIRITDFNVSFRVPVEGEMELVHKDGWGTRGYRAPEIYLRQGSGGMLFACDWFSCGATFYEMLTGQVPFTVSDKTNAAGVEGEETPLTRMLRRVQSRDFDLDRVGAEEDLRDFCQALLEYDPHARLNDDNVMQHAFLRSIDFDRLERGEIRPPWVPSEDQTAAASSTVTAFSGSTTSASRGRNNLGLFAKNFDVKVDERERLRALNSNLLAAGLYDDDGDDVELEDVLTAEEQRMFASWTFNANAPISAKSAAGEQEQLPLFGLLQSVSALSTPQAARDFIAQVDDATLSALLAEMKRVHEDLLWENAKFIQAEMRCDEMSRELAKLRAELDKKPPSQWDVNAATAMLDRAENHEEEPTILSFTTEDQSSLVEQAQEQAEEEAASTVAAQEQAEEVANTAAAQEQAEEEVAIMVAAQKKAKEEAASTAVAQEPVKDVAPVQEQEEEAAPVQEQEEEAAPVQEQEEEAAPLQEQEEEAPPTAPMQEQEEEVAPLQEQVEDAVPVQEPVEDAAPSQEPVEDTAPTQEPAQLATPPALDEPDLPAPPPPPPAAAASSSEEQTKSKRVSSRRRKRSQEDTTQYEATV